MSIPGEKFYALYLTHQQLVDLNELMSHNGTARITEFCKDTAFKFNGETITPDLNPSKVINLMEEVFQAIGNGPCSLAVLQSNPDRNNLRKP